MKITVGCMSMGEHSQKFRPLHACEHSEGPDARGQMTVVDQLATLPGHIYYTPIRVLARESQNIFGHKNNVVGEF